jgi:hypothetical protein
MGEFQGRFRKVPKSRPNVPIYDKSRQNWVWDTRIATVFLVGFHGLEVKVTEFQDNYVWIVKFNELKEEG